MHLRSPGRDAASSESSSPLAPPLARRECKYLIDADRAQAVRRFARPFVRPDRHASEGARYAVETLYLDSADLRLYRWTATGARARFKLRVRRYLGSPGAPVFFEIKRRLDDAVYKVRVRVAPARALDLLANFSRGERPTTDEHDLAEFARLTAELRARPRLSVRYLREAWEGASGEPVRLTFDTELAHARTETLGPAVWHATPIGAVVLELKFNGRAPEWLRALVRRFELTRVSVPKYVLSVDAARALEHRVPLADEGGVVPWRAC